MLNSEINHNANDIDTTKSEPHALSLEQHLLVKEETNTCCGASSIPSIFLSHFYVSSQTRSNSADSFQMEPQLDDVYDVVGML